MLKKKKQQNKKQMNFLKVGTTFQAVPEEKQKQKKHCSNSAFPVLLYRKVTKNMHDPQYI